MRIYHRTVRRLALNFKGEFLALLYFLRITEKQERRLKFAAEKNWKKRTLKSTI